MKILEHKKKTIGFLAVLFFTFTGTYNAVVINSESTIASYDFKYVKRLDESYGIIKPGRMVAASTSWQKLGPKPVAKVEKPVVQEIKKVEAAPVQVAESSPEPTAAAVQEELDLNLVEVVNPKKWKQGLSAEQFIGNLLTNNGVIESLEVALPNGEGISVSFSEMTGNVFEYDFYGELYSGMMYQVDQHSYMVTLTNGPLEGTRMRFTSREQLEQQQMAQEYAAYDQLMEPGQFGNPALNGPEQPEALVQNDQAYQMQGEQVQGFNMEQTAQAL